jgi:hypothetical protein
MLPHPQGWRIRSTPDSEVNSVLNSDLMLEDKNLYSLCHENLNIYVNIKMVARFEVITAVLLNIQVLWDITLCWAINSQHLEGLKCLQHIGNYLNSKTASHPIFSTWFLICTVNTNTVKVAWFFLTGWAGLWSRGCDTWSSDYIRYGRWYQREAVGGGWERSGNSRYLQCALVL